MRILMKINIPVEEGNHLMADGKLTSMIKSILDEQKPEAVYFGDDNGQRTAFVVVQINDGSEIPRLAEPWFMAFDAKIEMHPVMTVEDLEKAMPAIKKVASEYAMT